MTDKKVPKARLLTIEEVIGASSPEEFGFGPITSAIESIILEKLGDKKEDKLNIFKKRGITCSTVMAPSYRHYQPTSRKDGDIIVYPSSYRVKNDYQDCDEIRHLSIGEQGNIEFDSDAYAGKVRVAFKWSEIKDYCQYITTADDGIIEAEYGLWPIDDQNYGWLTKELLELLYINQLRLHTLKQLPLGYSTNHEKYAKNSPRIISPVFEFDGTKFARIKENINGIGGSYDWVSLKPIKLWVDEEKDVAVSAYTVCRVPKYEDTESYLENFFSEEVFKGAILLQEKHKNSSNDTEEKPMFPGIEITEPSKSESSPKRVPGKQIVKVKIKQKNIPQDMNRK